MVAERFIESRLFLLEERRVHNQCFQIFEVIHCTIHLSGGLRKEEMELHFSKKE